MLNLTIIGNIGNDCQIKENGTKKFATFSVAHTEKFKNQDGTVTERTQWVNCIINNADDKRIPYLKKGAKVYVQGKPQFKIYTNSQNTTQIDVSMSVMAIEFCGGANNNNNTQTPNTNATPEPAQNVDFNNVNDDLPF